MWQIPLNDYGASQGVILGEQDGASQGVILGEELSVTIAAPSVEMDDEMPPLVASDSEFDDDEDESESSDGVRRMILLTMMTGTNGAQQQGLHQA